jgi:hypothetical protein
MWQANKNGNKKKGMTMIKKAKSIRVNIVTRIIANPQNIPIAMLA